MVATANGRSQVFRLDQPPTLRPQGKTVQNGDHPLVVPVTCLPADSQNPKRNA